MKYSPERALELLRQGTGDENSTFQRDQEKAIQHVVENRGSLLVVQRTGWGKSFVYFIATKLLREAREGPVLLISPLLALMRDQRRMAKNMGIRAEYINSSNVKKWDEIEDKIENDDVDILIISPERFKNPYFEINILEDIVDKVSMLVVDEAHCISDWGHDFRPKYKLLTKAIKRIENEKGSELRLLATTATANNRVVEDIEDVLGDDIEELRGNLNRETLALQTIDMPDKAKRFAWLAERLREIDGSGIIYVLTRWDAELVADFLKLQGLDVEHYTAKVKNREELENKLHDNDLKALVATTALGMGFDKPDVKFVIHYQMPGSPVAYYQQVGRAGREEGCNAYGVILKGKEDSRVIRSFIRNAFPKRRVFKAILDILEEHPNGLTEKTMIEMIPKPEQMKQYRHKERVNKALELLSLELDPPIVKEGYVWQLSNYDLDPRFWERMHDVKSNRRHEHEQMEEYMLLSHGEHMNFLINKLDGDPEDTRPADLPALIDEVAPGLIREANEYLNRPKPSKPRDEEEEIDEK